MSLSLAVKIAALRLARSANIGPLTYANLIAEFGGPEAAIDALPSLLKARKLSRVEIASEAAAERELARADAIRARLLIIGDDLYPERLAATEGAPPILFVIGDAEMLSASAIAIVGARNASGNGRKMAELLARGLGAAGQVVVSGLARGIDQAAHRGALETGTIAVLAGGVDQCYPEEHRDLYAEIAEKGAIVSEMPIGHNARAVDFPRRNRIIAGLSKGVVVVEAAERSGSLITARNALEQGREVFAVPGSPLDARCRGTNQLLRDGAVLTESVRDIMSALPVENVPDRPASRILSPRPISIRSSSGPAYARPSGQVPAEPNRPLADRLLELLDASPIAIDDLVRQSGADPASVQAALLDLELEGRLMRHAGQSVSLVMAPQS